MDFSKIEMTFADIGGQFITSAFDLQEKLTHIKAFVFDWDGVFNAANKNNDTDSSFSEIDNTGIDLLRFGYYLRQGKMPITAIFSESESKSAQHYVQREHFNAIHFHCTNKIGALDAFCKNYNLHPQEICYVYDDIHDITTAEKTGIRLAIGRLCNPVFHHYLEANHLADYISACQGQEHALREFSELLLLLMENYFETVEHYARQNNSYSEFHKQKMNIDTSYHNHKLQNNSN